MHFLRSFSVFILKIEKTEKCLVKCRKTFSRETFYFEIFKKCPMSLEKVYGYIEMSKG